MANEIKLSQNTATALVLVVSTVIVSLGVVAYDSANKNGGFWSGRNSYKDGNYEAVGSYVSPGGEETVNVKLTLKDNVITDSEVVGNATLPASVKFQDVFIENYKQYVVGKNIDEVQLDVISGSSLTPKGFNDALELIKQDAKA